MYTDFLLTGATGFLGNTIAWKLYEKGFRCRALVSPDNRLIKKLPPETELCYGNLFEEDSLDRFFSEKAEETCVIHCAGIVSIATAPNPNIYKVNVEGTKKILQLASKNHIGKMIHVSSIHAIPDKPAGETITETKKFDENLVRGEYAKSKAIASRMALQAAEDGLNVSVVHPSGIIGPCDWKHGQITNAIISYCSGKLPSGVRGGNNFVDVRDAADGILACAENGAAGENYILSGHCSTVKEILEYVRTLVHGKKLFYLPLNLVKMIAPLYEKVAVSHGKIPFLTPYSAYALGANANYSHEKATAAFGYSPRSLEETVEDTIKWLIGTKQICLDPALN